MLPTAALPFATGGDDMPVVALDAAGLVALTTSKTGVGRARPRRGVVPQVHRVAAGDVRDLGGIRPELAASGRSLRAGRRRGRRTRRAAGRLLQHLSAFVDNVIRFPLGLAGVSSPAASALPRTHPGVRVPGDPSALSGRRRSGRRRSCSCAICCDTLLATRPGVAALTGWVMLVAIVLAPATRVGLPALSDQPVRLGVDVRPGRGAGDRWRVPVDGGEAGATVGDGWADQFSSSGSWKSSTEYGVTPADGRRGDHDAHLPVEPVAAPVLCQHFGAASAASAGTDVDHLPTELRKEGVEGVDHLRRRKRATGEGHRAIELALVLVAVDGAPHAELPAGTARLPRMSAGGSPEPTIEWSAEVAGVRDTTVPSGIVTLWIVSVGEEPVTSAEASTPARRMKTAIPRTTSAGPRADTLGTYGGPGRPARHPTAGASGASVSSGVAPIMTPTCYRAARRPLRVGQAWLHSENPAEAGRGGAERRERWGSVKQVAASTRSDRRGTDGEPAGVPRYCGGRRSRRGIGRVRRRFVLFVGDGRVRLLPRRPPGVSGSRPTRRQRSARTSCPKSTTSSS